MILHQLSKGFLGLTSSKKGVLCLMLFFCSLAPMTALCFLGKLDGTAYGVCLTAVTTAVVAVFCHAVSRTEIAAMQQPTVSSVVSTIQTAVNSGPPANLPDGTESGEHQ